MISVRGQRRVKHKDCLMCRGTLHQMVLEALMLSCRSKHCAEGLQLIMDAPVSNGTDPCQMCTFFTSISSDPQEAKKQIIDFIFNTPVPAEQQWEQQS